MAGVFYVDAEQIVAAIKNLDAAHDDADQSCQAITDVRAEQGSGKWGTQPGPTVFSAAYASALSSLEDSIDKERQLADRIAKLRAGMDAIRQAAETIDDDAATDLLKIQLASQPGTTTGP